MEPTALIAATLTVVLILVAVLCAVGGSVLWCIDRTRCLAPFVALIPTLAIFGATGGSWGFSYLAAMSEVSGMSDRPLWAWIVGLPIGGILGGLFGLFLARLINSGLTRRRSQHLTLGESKAS